MLFAVMTIFSDSEGKISIGAAERTVWDDPGMLTHATMTDTTVMIAKRTWNRV